MNVRVCVCAIAQKNSATALLLRTLLRYLILVIYVAFFLTSRKDDKADFD